MCSSGCSVNASPQTFTFFQFCCHLFRAQCGFFGRRPSTLSVHCFVLCVGRFRFFHSCFFRLHSCLSLDRFSPSFGLRFNTGNNSNLYAQFAEALTEITTRKSRRINENWKRTYRSGILDLLLLLFLGKNYSLALQYVLRSLKEACTQMNEQIRIELRKNTRPFEQSTTARTSQKWNGIESHMNVK